eukprot:4610869-Amphidinium_carterae.1
MSSGGLKALQDTVSTSYSNQALDVPDLRCSVGDLSCGACGHQRCMSCLVKRRLARCVAADRDVSPG